MVFKRFSQTIFLGVLFCFIISPFSSFGQNSSIDSLSILLKSSTNITQKINLHLKLSRLKIHSNSKSALKHISTAQTLAKQISNDSIQFEIYSSYINHYFINQNYQYTFAYIDSALVYKNIVSPEKIIKLHTVLAQASNFIGDYEQAITAYSTALDICNENNLENHKIGILNGMSSIYLTKGNYAYAENYAEEAIELSKKINRTISQMYAELNLGHAYFKQDKTIEALKVYKMVEYYLKENKSMVLQHSVNTALGRWYKNDKQYEKAIPYFKDNLAIDQSINNSIGINTNRADIAFVLIQQKKYGEAISILKENLSHAKAIENPNLVQQNLLNLSQAFELNKNFDKALTHRKSYEKWHENIVSSDNLKAISELDIKYKTEKKEKDILQLKQTKLQNEISIQKQNLWIKRLVYGFIITLLLSSAGFIIFKQRSNYKKQKELITAITDTQISEQQRIAQDLHDSVGGSLALAKTKLTTLSNIENDNEVINELINTLTDTSDQVRQISHDLMPGELVKFGLIPAVNALLNQIETETLSTNLYTHDTDERLDEKKEVHLFRIIQELVQNVLKHAKANVLNIYINRHPKSLNLIVEDDGLGFDVTKNEQEGIGFKTIKNRIDYLNGSLKTDSKKGRGTSFNIQIPLQI